MIFGILLYTGPRPRPVPEIFHQEDKLYHLLGFATLAIGTRLALPRQAWWWQALAMLALGAGIELVQNLEPARVGSVWNFLFDAIGVRAGLLAVQLALFNRWRAPP